MLKINSKFGLTPMALAIIGLGCTTVSYASPILPGFDLFQTLPGAEVDLGCTVVPLKGNPALLASENIGPTDTIVERLQGIDPFDVPNGVGTIDIELVALSLKSRNSFDGTCLGLPGLVDLYVTVNTDLGERPDLLVPDAPLPPSIGTMTIHHENADAATIQGRFSSVLEVFADLIFVWPGGDVSNLADWIISMPAPDAPLRLPSTGIWTHTKPLYDHHNVQYPAGDFYIPPTIDPVCEGESCIKHTGPHPVEPTLVTLIDNSFIATASNGGVTITWETASEIENAGFFVWRGQLKAGKTKCSNKAKSYTEVKRISSLLPAQGSGSFYSYSDNQVVSGNTYCYALEDVDLMDKHTFHIDDITAASVQ